LQAVFRCLLCGGFTKAESVRQWSDGKKAIEDCFNVRRIAGACGLTQYAVKKAIRKLLRRDGGYC